MDRFPHIASQTDIDREALIRRAARVAEFITIAVLFVALAVFGPAACEMAVM